MTHRWVIVRDIIRGLHLSYPVTVTIPHGLVERVETRTLPKQVPTNSDLEFVYHERYFPWCFGGRIRNQNYSSVVRVGGIRLIFSRGIDTYGQTGAFLEDRYLVQGKESDRTRPPGHEEGTRQRYPTTGMRLFTCPTVWQSFSKLLTKINVSSSSRVTVKLV